MIRQTPQNIVPKVAYAEFFNEIRGLLPVTSGDLEVGSADPFCRLASVRLERARPEVVIFARVAEVNWIRGLRRAEVVYKTRSNLAWDLSSRN